MSARIVSAEVFSDEYVIVFGQKFPTPAGVVIYDLNLPPFPDDYAGVGLVLFS